MIYLFRKKCLDGCPSDTHCEWGFCECDEGFIKAKGRCSDSFYETVDSQTRTSLDCETYTVTCSTTAECQSADINMICVNTECVCRRDMEWNKKALECQV